MFEQISEMQAKYPIPGYYLWWKNSFPSRQIAFVGAGMIVIGMVFTGFKLDRKHIASVTFQILALVVYLVVMFLIAVIKKQRNDKKRAAFLNITLEEYYKLPLEWQK
jgi:cell division protein FtsW (lipid II flippase)